MKSIKNQKTLQRLGRKPKTKKRRPKIALTLPGIFSPGYLIITFQIIMIVAIMNIPINPPDDDTKPPQGEATPTNKPETK